MDTRNETHGHSIHQRERSSGRGHSPPRASSSSPCNEGHPLSREPFPHRDVISPLSLAYSPLSLPKATDSGEMCNGEGISSSIGPPQVQYSRVRRKKVSIKSFALRLERDISRDDIHLSLQEANALREGTRCVNEPSDSRALSPASMAGEEAEASLSDLRPDEGLAQPAGVLDLTDRRNWQLASVPLPPAAQAEQGNSGGEGAGPGDPSAYSNPLSIPEEEAEAEGLVARTLETFDVIRRMIQRKKDAKGADVAVSAEDQAVLNELPTPVQVAVRQFCGNLLRPDMVAGKIMRAHKLVIFNSKERIIGAIPGVRVGQRFQFRQEMAVIGMNLQAQGGIDFFKRASDGCTIATAVVLSGGYEDDRDDGESFEYTGQGGNDYLGSKVQLSDQVLERGNLGLAGSVENETPVRVVRCNVDKGAKEYIYDGLYTVTDYRKTKGKNGYEVFKFDFVRIPGQPPLSSRSVVFRELTGLAAPSVPQLEGPRAPRSERKRVPRRHEVVEDISFGAEDVKLPACNAVEEDPTVPPRFTYLKAVNYGEMVPPEVHLEPAEVCCDCQDGCLVPEVCKCVAVNGAAYERDGRLKDSALQRPLFECGPSCACNKSAAEGRQGKSDEEGHDEPAGNSLCHNRVSQHGLRLRLEVFKTRGKGWGVRCRDFIPSGTMVCAYTGTLMDGEQADSLVGEDEYLFGLHLFECLQGRWGTHPVVRALEESAALGSPSPPITPDLMLPERAEHAEHQGTGPPGHVEEGDGPRVEGGGEGKGGNSKENESEDLDVPGPESKKDKKHEGGCGEKRKHGEASWEAVAGGHLEAGVAGIEKVPRVEEAKELDPLPLFIALSPSPAGCGTLEQPITIGEDEDEDSDDDIVECPAVSREREHSQVLTLPVSGAGSAADPLVLDGEEELELSAENSGEDVQRALGELRGAGCCVPAQQRMSSEDEVLEMAGVGSHPCMHTVEPGQTAVSAQGLDGTASARCDVSLPLGELPTASTEFTMDLLGDLAASSVQQPGEAVVARDEGSPLPRGQPSTVGGSTRLPDSPAVGGLDDANGALLLPGPEAKDEGVRDLGRTQGRLRSSHTSQRRDGTGVSRPHVMGQQQPDDGGEIHPLLGLPPAMLANLAKFNGEEHKFFLDGMKTGNVSRFINHSCDPNLAMHSVFHDHWDPRFPHIVLFAGKDIRKGEELSYDYGYAVDSITGPDGQIKQKACCCGASGCRGRLY